MIIKDLGCSIVKMHDYDSAKEYYEDSLNRMKDTVDKNNLYSFYDIVDDYVSLLVKLAKVDASNYANVKNVLNEYIRRMSKSELDSDVKLKRKLSRLLFMLATVNKEIKKSSNTVDDADIVDNFTKAIDLSKEVLFGYKDAMNETLIKTEKQFLSLLFYEVGQYYEINEGKLEYAEKSYLEAVNKYDSKHEKFFFNQSTI